MGRAVAYGGISAREIKEIEAASLSASRPQRGCSSLRIGRIGLTAFKNQLLYFGRLIRQYAAPFFRSRFQQSAVFQYQRGRMDVAEPIAGLALRYGQDLGRVVFKIQKADVFSVPHHISCKRLTEELPFFMHACNGFQTGKPSVRLSGFGFLADLRIERDAFQIAEHKGIFPEGEQFGNGYPCRTQFVQAF